MKPKTIASIVAIVAVASLLSFAIPKGWQKSGSAEDKYEMGLWKIGGHDSSKACGVIRASKKNYDIGEYGSLIQKVSSQRYLGKRIRFTGFMKSRAVTGWAGFFVRADNEDDKKPLTFDNMHDRPVKGTTDWKAYTIELDVPFNASKVTFGALLHGEGQVWFDDISIEVTGNSSITADYVKCDTSLRREPENISFEQ